MVWELWCFEDLGEKDELLNELISYGGVCRTAPATPGLLIIINCCVQTFLSVLT